MKKINQWLLNHMTWVKVLVFILALAPFIYLVYQGVSNQMGANPVDFITKRTGKLTLIFLCLTLALTPLRQLTRLNVLVRLRRMLGLFTFFYVFCHFITWVWFDQFFSVSGMLKDIQKRPFITVGFAAFVLLIPLALTSFNRAIKWLGAKNWQHLHRAIYLIALLGILHYYWMREAKHNLANVKIYAVIILILLGYRLCRMVLDKTGIKHTMQ